MSKLEVDLAKLIAKANEQGKGLIDQMKHLGERMEQIGTAGADAKREAADKIRRLEDMVRTWYGRLVSRSCRGRVADIGSSCVSTFLAFAPFRTCVVCTITPCHYHSICWWPLLLGHRRPRFILSSP